MVVDVLLDTSHKCNTSVVSLTLSLYTYPWIYGSQMSKQKNDILKEICAALALAVGGTKAVLLERIQEALSKL